MANGFSRFEEYVPIQWNLPKTDLGVLSGVLEAKQKRFDTGYELADKLGQAQIDALPQDRARANTILSEWDKKKEEIVSKYNGDYSSAYRDLDMLRRDMEKLLRPGGEANAIIANKASFADWYSRMSKDKEVNPESLNLAYQYYMSPESKGYYSGVGEKNPITQSYNVFNPEEVIGYTNPDTVVLPAIKALEASGFEKEWDSIGGQWIMRNKQSGEELTEEEIARTAFRALANDKNYFNSLSQTARFRGEEGYDPTEYALKLAQSYGADYAYSRTKQSQTVSPNEWGMAKYKADRDDARQNQLLDGMSNIPTQRGTLDYSENVLGKDLTMNDLDPQSYRYSGQNKGMSPWVGYEAYQEQARFSSDLSKGRTLIENQIKNGDFGLAGGNTNLMKKVLDLNPNFTGEQLLIEYNRQKKVIGAATMSATDVFSTKAGEDFAQQLLNSPVGQYTTISVASPGKGVQNIPYQDFMKRYRGEIYDEKTGNLKDRFKNLSVKTDGSDGHTPGFVMKMEDGTTVKFAAPPAYVRAKQPVIDLTEAYHNPTGEGYTAGVPGFNLDFRDPKSGEIVMQRWENTPLKMKVDYEKNEFGNLEPKKVLYEFTRTAKYPEGTWEKAQYSYPDRYGNIHKADLDINMLNQQLNEKALQANFTTTQQSAKNTFIEDSFGNKIRVQ